MVTNGSTPRGKEPRHFITCCSRSTSFITATPQMPCARLCGCGNMSHCSHLMKYTLSSHSPLSTPNSLGSAQMRSSSSNRCLLGNRGLHASASSHLLSSHDIRPRTQQHAEIAATIVVRPSRNGTHDVPIVAPPSHVASHQGGLYWIPHRSWLAASASINSMKQSNKQDAIVLCATHRCKWEFNHLAQLHSMNHHHGHGLDARWVGRRVFSFARRVAGKATCDSVVDWSARKSNSQRSDPVRCVGEPFE